MDQPYSTFPPPSRPVANSNTLVMFGLVLGALLLVPVLLVCGNEADGTREPLESITGRLGAEPASEIARDGAGADTAIAGESVASDLAEVFSEAPAGEIYIIVAGDTLWDIAQRTGLTVEELAAANGVTPDVLLLPGDEIVIPPASSD